jgi:hypothetical protein
MKKLDFHYRFVILKKSTKQDFEANKSMQLLKEKY